MKTDVAIEGLVHDLNNVFTTISDAADLIETDPKWAALAAILQRSVSLGQRILGSFAERGETPAGLDAVLESAMGFAGDFLQAQGAQVEFRCDCDAGIRLGGSRVAWERALFNLLINAGQAMGRGTVEIHGRRVGDEVEVTVADSGPGIPEENLARIFEPGFSTSPARSGLGLHIVESIVTHNGGSISAANRAGASGAVFRLVARCDCAA